MKKILIWGLVGLVAIFVIAVVALTLSLDKIVKSGVETVGPKLTQTDIGLKGVNISLLGGSATLKGLHVGNPKGYTSPTAIDADSISVSLVPSSITSDKVVIRSLRLDAPQIHIEGSPTDNNLTAILANVQNAAGMTNQTSSASSGADKKMQVDDLLITNGKVTFQFKMLGNKSITVPLPEVHLTQLGQGPEGITAGDLTKRVLSEVMGGVTKAAASETVKNFTSDITGAAKDVGKGAVEGVNKAASGIKNLFKK